MNLREGVALSELTTLRVGGSAHFVITITGKEEIPTALAFVRERGLPFVVLGQGSNVLANDAPYEGAVLLMHILGSTYEDDGDDVLVTAGGGERWDGLVSEC